MWTVTFELEVETEADKVKAREWLAEAVKSGNRESLIDDWTLDTHTGNGPL